MKKYYIIIVFSNWLISSCGCDHQPIDTLRDSDYPINSCLSIEEQEIIFPQVGINYQRMLEDSGYVVHSCHKKNDTIYLLSYTSVIFPYGSKSNPSNCILYNGVCIEATLDKNQKVINHKKIFHFKNPGNIDNAKLGFDSLVKEGFVPDSLFEDRAYTLKR